MYCSVAGNVENTGLLKDSPKDSWTQRNLFAVCDRVQSAMNENEHLMCFDPGLPALFFKTNARCWDNIPYDSVEGVLVLAEAHGVDCIVLDDKAFPHYLRLREIPHCCLNRGKKSPR